MTTESGAPQKQSYTFLDKIKSTIFPRYVVLISLDEVIVAQVSHMALRPLDGLFDCYGNNSLYGQK